MRFLNVLRRICIGGLDREGKFGDIMLADILTSYAKVLGDLWVTGCMFLGGVSAAGKPDRACGGKLAVPLVIRYFPLLCFSPFGLGVSPLVSVLLLFVCLLPCAFVLDFNFGGPPVSTGRFSF